MIHRRLLLTLCGAWLIGTSALGQEWTRFRGPNGTGISPATTIPASWKETDYLWKITLPGIGHSSPVLWGDNIFLQSADEAGDGTHYVLCVSAADGKVQWKQTFPSKKHAIHVQNSLASSTPAVDEQYVYCAWASPEELTLAALKHDGTTAWRANLGPFVSMHGFGTSPILFEDLVILTNDQEGESSLIALERASGLVRWKVARKNHGEQNTSYAAPCVFQPQRGPLEMIVASWAYGITSIEPRSGKTNWEAAVLERRPVGSPIVAAGLILANCGEGSGNNNVVAIEPGNAGGREASLVYKIDKTSAPYVPTLIAHDSMVFLWGDKGIVACIDAASGRIHWRERVGGNYSSSPVYAAGRIYCASAEGEVVTLAASDRYQLLGRSPLGEPTRATPAIAGGRMFLRTESHLMAVGRK